MGSEATRKYEIILKSGHVDTFYYNKRACIINEFLRHKRLKWWQPFNNALYKVDEIASICFYD